MAFPNSLRYPNGMRSPDADQSFASMMSKRDSYSNTPTAAADIRASLQRRFTTDSSKIPMGRASFSSQPYSSLNSAAQLEQKQIFEDIQIARRKAHEQLALLDEKERKLQITNGSGTAASTSNGNAQPEIDHFAGNFKRMSLNGPVSEPTTPPDYSEDVFSNRFSRSSRVSMSNITSPPGLSKRTSIASSKITSPPGNRVSNSGMYSAHRQSTKSMPGSRRGSDEEEDYLETLPTNRSAAALNRFSMPVNGSRNPQTTNVRASHPGIIYDEQDALYSTYSALTGDDESFPTLRSDGSRLNYADEQIAGAGVIEEEGYNYESRVRPGHASMPHNDSSLYRQGINSLSSPLDRPAEPARRKSQRYSSGVTFSSDVPPVPTTTQAIPRPTALQPSYSMNDVPTVKNTLGRDPGSNIAQGDAHFHQHNVSMGRIPPGAAQSRQSREISSAGNGAQYKQDDKALSQLSALQANAAPFAAGFGNDISALPQPGVSAPYQYAMGAYDMNSFTAAPTMNGQAAYNGIPVNQQFGRQEARNGRRNQDLGRLENAPLESFQGNLLEMSKDQHGCRFMQRKLEDGNTAHIQMIFAETCPHIHELMIDPFGNYLCQKLFEHCDDAQRSALIHSAASRLPLIALNQHGTRALQKMIEFVRTDEQVDIIIAALTKDVVQLVQDLNGNHVIQKCLQVLGAERCQFIYDEVGANCVQVGTHRHGCCVLQRCIDHAKGQQRAQLVAQITSCAFQLVQDAYGNYVVQYILDIDEVNYTRPLCQSFKGKIVGLSKQKFSSNVIEKCLRVADPNTKAEMITEMLMGNELEKMLRDSFANYVVQTALDYGDPASKARIMDTVMPILPAIKQTPHGRRIASKIQTMKSQQQAPVDNAFVGGRSNNRRQIQINGGGFVYGGHGFAPTGFAPNEYGSGDPSTTNPLGYTQTAFAPAFNPPGGMGNGMGNYI